MPVAEGLIARTSILQARPSRATRYMWGLQSAAPNQSGVVSWWMGCHGGLHHFPILENVKA